MKNFNAQLRTLFILTLALPLSFISCSVENEETVGGTTGGSKDQIIISEQYFPLEDYDYSVQNAKVDDGVYTLSFENENPNIVNGSVIQIDMDTVVQLVRVISIEGSGENVTIKTEPADLGDIFINGSFTLSTEGMSSAKTRNTIPNSNVFYPTSLTYFDENNEKHTVEFIDGTRGGFDKRLYSKFIDYSGYTIAETEHTRTYLETCTFDFNLDLVMSYNFEEIKEGYNKYRRGELVMNKSAIKGDLNTDLMVRFDAKAKTEQKLDEVCIKPNIHKPIIAKFMVGPVPVVVVMNTNLYVDGSYEAEGEFSAYTGFATETDVELGFSWKQGSDLKPYADFNFKPKWHKPTVEGSAHLESKISVFPRINFSVYGLLGPAFDIKPYVRQTLDLGIYDMMGSNDKDFYGATYNMFTGYDAAVSMTLMPIKNTHTFVKSSSWNVLNKQIIKAPESIKFVGESVSEIVPTKKYVFNFLVKDKEMIAGNTVNSILPWPVKFITNCGKLSSEFVNADISSSIATVTWTPTSSTNDSEDPYVKAVIYDASGKEILTDKIIFSFNSDDEGNDDNNDDESDGGNDNSESEVKDLCPDGNHPHMIDLGLSSGTRWACCNVGASSPFEYGDYFAWGETTPTEERRRGYNYKFFVSHDNAILTKYCHYKNAFNTDDYKSVLDLEDDAAYVNMGKEWKMPTIEECEELIRECKLEYYSNNNTNVRGCKFIGVNGNSILIPFTGTAGYEYEDDYARTHGDYWSNTLDLSYVVGGQIMSDKAMGFYVTYSYKNYKNVGVSKIKSDYRDMGLNVRAVER